MTMSAAIELIAEREPLDTTAIVETPEHVRFRYQLAGPARRIIAYVIDLFVRGAIVFAIRDACRARRSDRVRDGLGGAGLGMVLVVMFAVEWGYYVLLETLTAGRSIGKRAMRLRVVKQGGLPLGFGDSVLRNLLRAADFLPSFYALGLLVMSNDRCFRRLGDMVAGTLVISEERIVMQQALRISPAPTAAELAAASRTPAAFAGRRRGDRALFAARRRALAGPGERARRDGRADLRAANGRALSRCRRAFSPCSITAPRSEAEVAMQTRDEFVARCSPRWHELETLLQRRPQSPRATGADDLTRCHAVPSGVRRSDARTRPGLRQRRHRTPRRDRRPRAQRALRAAALSPSRRLGSSSLAISRAPCARAWPFFAISIALFGLPLALGLGGALHSPEFAYGVLPQSALEQAAESYAEGFGRGRGEGEDTMMAGFYVYNNVGIAFRCFATGISVRYRQRLLPHLQRPGDRHGARARDRVGQRSQHPHLRLRPRSVRAHRDRDLGRRRAEDGLGVDRHRRPTRLGSLRARARDLVELIVGAALMLIIAAP